MRTEELINEIESLPIQKRIYVIEKTFQSIRKQSDTNQMSIAAEDLFSEYVSNNELTALSNLAIEDFYQARWSLADCFQVRSVAKERFVIKLGTISGEIIDEIKLGLSVVLSIGY